MSDHLLEDRREPFAGRGSARSRRGRPVGIAVGTHDDGRYHLVWDGVDAVGSGAREGLFRPGGR
ncbi:hypothetical protein BRC93_10905 [Halobacteriales archaeon QS_5_70_15]|nr:MAG: hypothetical protein BRC93_10905 [Halobacteriales archaeon QS_5_70_15]